MKKTKVIVPALGILLLSTAASVTGTVAWFSSNSNVDATGMNVKARTDSNFLVICLGNEFNSSVTTTSVASSGDVSLSPVAPIKANVTTDTAAKTAANWQYAYSADPNDYQKEGGYTACTSLTNYVASESFAIGLTATSGQATTSTNLMMEVTLPADTGISCVVALNGGNVIGIFEESTTEAVSLGVPASKTGTVVNVYYYLNGEDPNVFSKNIYVDETAATPVIKLQGKVTLDFSI